jgi:hypothetical protein
MILNPSGVTENQPLTEKNAGGCFLFSSNFQAFTNIHDFSY